MHERSLVRTLLRQVQAVQQERGASRVVTVRVSVGEFAGVDEDLFRSAFDELVGDSPIRGARLESVSIPLGGRCQSCGREFTVADFKFQCPACGDSSIELIRGEGVVLESVTLE